LPKPCPIHDKEETQAKKGSDNMKCDQCNLAVINGSICHETGCPNTNARYDAESKTWIKQYTCSICGYEHDIGTSCEEE
jgi:hypothetical protein